MSASMVNQPVVFVPCPGRPACPEHLFDVESHQHFARFTGKVRVRRVVPGCWEALCPCCLTWPLAAQVSSWERAMRRAAEHLAGAHSPVGRVLTAADPCPPEGTVVRDDCGTTWVNSGCYPAAWMPAGGEGDSESWTKVAGNYGPVTVIEWGDHNEGV